MIIYVVRSEDLYRGYGGIAIGKTLSEAKKLFMKQYKEVAKNSSGRYADEKYLTASEKDSYEAIKDYYGIWEQKFKIGKAYFGDNDEDSPSSK